jgi:glycine/D-amino acid oxidase-like deaminating enzyme
VSGYAALSYWLESCGEDLTPRAPLDTSVDVDVAILGAGYTGLWTAYYLQQRDPTLRIAVVEKEIAGFGASGRNGAWCTSGFAAGPTMLRERYSTEVAATVHDLMVDTVAEVGRVCDAEGIDAHFQRDGEMVLARGTHQLPALHHIEQEYAAIGRGDFWVRLDAAAARDKLAVNGICGAVYQTASAAVHPGRLVRGLARAVESRGATIYEQTAVTDWTEGAHPTLRTTTGDVRARVVVLAGEGYLSQLGALRRQILPLYSLIVLTEPLEADQLEAIGWTHRTVLQSCALTVDYLSRTRDGRILFGGRGAPYHFGSRIRPEYDRHAATHDRLRALVREWFPQLGDMGFTHAWGGSVGVPRDFMPTMTYDRATGIASSRGYTGEGVAASNLGGRVLADQICDVDSELVRLPMVGHRSRNWEPEPLRWLATRYLQRASLRIDTKAAASGRAPTGKSIAERLIRH